jgi:aryl-alcohol dehydrogenase-like predicted oxidoreductase
VSSATTTLPGGTFRLADDLDVTRVGYGAMQLAGKGVFGPPKDHDGAIAVLRAVLDAGITHIDTADFYGPVVTNELIREALAPYPAGLHLVTKVGARRDDRGRWLGALGADELRRAVHDNLEHLGLDVLDLVNLRVHGIGDGGPHSVAEPFEVLAGLQQEGLIRHLGVSNMTGAQIAEARSVAPIVSVQNEYNLAHRGDDRLIDALAEEGIAYVPFFPLGGFSPLQSATLDAVAADLGAAPLAVALAWLLQRSPNILLIPGTKSVDHLHENIAGAGLALPPEAVARLNALA